MCISAITNNRQNSKIHIIYKYVLLIRENVHHWFLRIQNVHSLLNSSSLPYHH
jgi:hypothetical protein